MLLPESEDARVPGGGAALLELGTSQGWNNSVCGRARFACTPGHALIELRMLCKCTCRTRPCAAWRSGSVAGARTRDDTRAKRHAAHVCPLFSAVCGMQGLTVGASACCAAQNAQKSASMHRNFTPLVRAGRHPAWFPPVWLLQFAPQLTRMLKHFTTVT
eukprot:scaffold135842_cov21-Tisochrysis_lutea.AAC.1